MAEREETAAARRDEASALLGAHGPNFAHVLGRGGRREEEVGAEARVALERARDLLDEVRPWA